MINIAATFSVAQQYSSGAGSVTLLGATGSLWNFKQATDYGTQNYNVLGSNIPAGQNSYGAWFRPYWSTTATNTFSNIRFYQSTTWTNANYAAVGTSATAYTQSISSATATANGGASNVGVPTGSATNQAIALGTLTLGNTTGYGPTYLVVQLTTNASAPAGDTPYGGSNLWVHFKSFLINGKYLISRQSPTSRLIVVQLQRLSEKTIFMIDATVRTCRRLQELSRNDLTLAF